MGYSDIEKSRAAKRAHYAANKEQYAQRNANQRKRNQDFVLDYLNTHPCVDCGEKDPRCLQFDHRDRTLKEFNVSKMIRDGYGIDRMLAEIVKCDVRCANCHAKRTCEQFKWYKN